MRFSKLTFEGSLVQTSCESPWGPLIILASPRGVRSILWDLDLRTCKSALSKIPHGNTAITGLAACQLTEFFTEGRTAFSLPLDAVGTEFQQRVWSSLRSIPFGTTKSYSDQAEELGGRNFCRAVARANHANPLSIVVPCHRVIGKNGHLTGYAGGLQAKASLLRLEQHGHLSAV